MTSTLTDPTAIDPLQRRRQDAITQQQAAIQAPAPVAVVACPGAGKTWTIVERHSRTPPDAPRGRAIISFTKVAANQIRRRARQMGRADLLEHPHAIMTLDAFLFRFLVRPFLTVPTADRPGTWTHIDSWSRAPRDVREVTYWVQRGDNRRPFHFDLTEFDFRYVSGRTVRARLNGDARHEGARNSLTDEQIAEVCAEAERARDATVQRHKLLTGEDIRLAAVYNLGRHARHLALTLNGRFDEMVVDEVQDCSDVDVHILLSIQRLGLPLVVIGDPDQAIYGFRNPGPPAMSQLLTTPPFVSSALRLTGNWRSAAVVCALSATLRADPDAQVPDVALPDHHDAAIPVQLLHLDAAANVQLFETIADQAGIPANGRLVLAHGTETLPGLTRRGKRPPANAAAALMWAVGIMRQEAPSRRLRELAEETLGSTIIRYWMPEPHDGQANRWEAYGVDPHHLRRLAAVALCDLPELSLPGGQWCERARRILDRLRPVPGAEPPAGIGLQCPRGGSATPAVQLCNLPSGPVRSTTRTDIVHQVKGDEADAVLVLLPDDDRTTRLLEAWRADQPTNEVGGGSDGINETEEALRVLYVAVTRARRLIALALPTQHVAATSTHLAERGVPVTVVQPAAQAIGN